MATDTNVTIGANTSAQEIVDIYQTDLTGKVVIVTGSNSGIGLEIARVLAYANAKVIIPSRTLEKSLEAIETIKKSVPNADLIPMKLDLADLASVRSFVHDFLMLDLPLDILINNAGRITNKKTFTKDGFESQFAVNYLGHFLLVQLLMEKIKANAPCRIIITSSCTNSQVVPKSGLDFDNLNGEKRGYSQMFTYGQTKLANIYHAKELQRRFDIQGVDVTVTSLHPGNVNTKLNDTVSVPLILDILKNMRNYRKGIPELLNRKQVDVGASTSIFCAVSPDVVKGGFYCDNALSTEFLHEEIDNMEISTKLWNLSEELVALEKN